MSVALATGVRVRAAIFDFNGTVCDDEGLLYEIVRDILRPHGVELAERTYFDELAGLADPELIAAALEREGIRVGDAAQERLVELRVSEYLRRAGADPPLRPGTQALIEALAGRVPLAVGSGALRAEVEHVLEAADLRRHFAVVVTAEDVERGKPDPETYATCLARLNETVGGEPVTRARSWCSRTRASASRPRRRRACTRSRCWGRSRPSAWRPPTSCCRSSASA